MQQKKTDQAIRAYKKYVDKNPSEVALAKFIGEEEYKAKNYLGSEKVSRHGLGDGDENRSVPSRFTEERPMRPKTIRPR